MIPSILSRCSTYQNKQEKQAQTADRLSLALQNASRCTLQEAQKHPLTLETKKFLRNVSKNHPEDPRIAKCRQQFLAFKLGVEASTLEAPSNHGFESFATHPPLERYLLVYNHHLKVNPETKEIHLLCNGQWRPWSEASELVGNPPLKQAYGVVPWLYGQEGVQKKNLFDWEELKPFKKEDPTVWGSQYIFEVCSDCSDHPKISGDHCWLRLRTPEGDVYSIGLYPKSWRSNPIPPMTIQCATLMQPDVAEFLPAPIRSLSVAITKEQFEKIKATIEEDKKKDKLLFQAAQVNCLCYVNGLGKLANINLPTESLPWRPLVGHRIRKALDSINPKLPRLILKVAEAVLTPFLNLIQVAGGGHKVDKKVKEQDTSCSPHIRSVFDIFKPSKARLHHPHTVGHYIREEVSSWRKEEAEKLEAEKAKLLAASDTEGAKLIDAKLAQLPHELPPAFRN